MATAASNILTGKVYYYRTTPNMDVPCIQPNIYSETKSIFDSDGFIYEGLQAKT